MLRATPEAITNTVQGLHAGLLACTAIDGFSQLSNSHILSATTWRMRLASEATLYVDRHWHEPEPPTDAGNVDELYLTLIRNGEPSEVWRDEGGHYLFNVEDNKLEISTDEDSDGEYGDDEILDLAGVESAPELASLLYRATFDGAAERIGEKSTVRYATGLNGGNTLAMTAESTFDGSSAQGQLEHSITLIADHDARKAGKPKALELAATIAQTGPDSWETTDFSASGVILGRRELNAGNVTKPDLLATRWLGRRVARICIADLQAKSNPVASEHMESLTARQ